MYVLLSHPQSQIFFVFAFCLFYFCALRSVDKCIKQKKVLRKLHEIVGP